MANVISIATKALQEAIKTVVDTISTNVGSNADSASTTGSVHAKIKSAKSVVDTINTNVGAKTDAASASGSLHAKTVNVGNIWDRVNANLDIKVSKSGIKSVQRGKHAGGGVSYSGGSYNYNNIYISINSIDPQKSFVIIAPSYVYLPEDLTRLYLPTVDSLSATTLTVTSSASTYGNTNCRAIEFSWQVIEFY